MKIDTNFPPLDLDQVPDFTQSAETIGFDAIWTSETQHDPFLPLTLIAEHSEKLLLGTAVAIAFARSPATVAYTAWDLAKLSRGRFILGLGTQVKPHIQRRFGMPWPESPVKHFARIRGRTARLLDILANRRQAQLPGGILQTHFNDSFL